MSLDGITNMIGQIFSDFFWLLFNLPGQLASWLLRLIPAPGGVIFERIGITINGFFLDVSGAIGVWAFITVMVGVTVIGWRILMRGDSSGALRAGVAVLLPLMILQGLGAAITQTDAQGTNAVGTPAWFAARSVDLITLTALGNLFDIGNEPVVAGGLCEADFNQAHQDALTGPTTGGQRERNAHIALLEDELAQLGDSESDQLRRDEIEATLRTLRAERGDRDVPPTVAAQLALANKSAAPRIRHAIIPSFGVKADSPEMSEYGIEDAWCQFSNRYEDPEDRRDRTHRVLGLNPDAAPGFDGDRVRAIHPAAFPTTRMGFVFLEQERLQVLSWAACEFTDDGGVRVRDSWEDTEESLADQSSCESWVETGAPAVEPNTRFMRGTEWGDDRAGQIGSRYMAASFGFVTGLFIFLAGLVWLVVSVVILLLGLLGPLLFGTMVVLLPATLTLRAAAQLKNSAGGF